MSKLKALKTKPLPGIVQLKIEAIEAGNLVTTSKQSAVEVAEVVAVGAGVQNLKAGDKVFVKAWAVDIITHEDVRYHFVDSASNGILAIIG